MTQPEGQTARDIFPEDDGIPEVAQDDSPTQERAEDPQFAPLPGEQPDAHRRLRHHRRSSRPRASRSTAGWPARSRTTRPTSARPRTRDRAGAQLEQDLDTTPTPTRAPTAPPTTSRPPPTRPSAARAPRRRAVHVTDG